MGDEWCLDWLCHDGLYGIYCGYYNDYMVQEKGVEQARGIDIDWPKMDSKMLKKAKKRTESGWNIHI